MAEPQHQNARPLAETKLLRFRDSIARRATWAGDLSTSPAEVIAESTAALVGGDDGRVRVRQFRGSTSCLAYIQRTIVWRPKPRLIVRATAGRGGGSRVWVGVHTGWTPLLVAVGAPVGGVAFAGVSLSDRISAGTLSAGDIVFALFLLIWVLGMGFGLLSVCYLMHRINDRDYQVLYRLSEALVDRFLSRWSE